MSRIPRILQLPLAFENSLINVLFARKFRARLVIGFRRCFAVVDVYPAPSLGGFGGMVFENGNDMTV